MKNSIDNLRSGISKNSLMFSTEFFNNKDCITNEKYRDIIIAFIKTAMPVIVFKSVHEKAFISKEAKNSITNCIENIICDEMLDVFIESGCNSKNKTL